jgi:hypothetical protein
MRANKLLMSLTLLVAALLAGCASFRPGTAEQKTQKLMSAAPEKSMKLIVVPVANNVVSDLMIIAALKAGTVSNAARNLVAMLKRSGGDPVGVTSDNDAIASATIVSALGQIEKGQPTAKLYYVGDASYIPELAEKTKAAGVAFEGIPYP